MSLPTWTNNRSRPLARTSIRTFMTLTGLKPWPDHRARCLARTQSGAIRIITNQPDTTQFAAGYDLEVNSVKSAGDLGYLAEGFVNIPMGDRAAVRLVAFVKEDAGYIDNVAATHTFSNANIRAGLTDPALIAIAADITIDNAAFVEKDFNEATTTGGRAALRVDLSENWTVTAGLMQQRLEAEGVWDHDPAEVGDLQVIRFQPDVYDDDWIQGSLLIDGQIGDVELTYAGSYLDRDSDSMTDYSLYTDFYISSGFIQRYYSCYVSYFGACTDPRILLTADQSWLRTNHEIRLKSSGDTRFRWMAGVFYEDSSHRFDFDWHVLGLAGLEGPGGVYCGTGTPPTSPARCQPAIDPPDIYWTTHPVRTAEETAFFGQVQYDFTDNLTGSLSARRFDYKSNMIGFSGTWWFPVGTACLGPGFQGCGQRQPFNYDLDTADTDTVVRANLQYSVNDDMMFYGTYSEGYRPGGLNRVFNTIIGGSYEPDFVNSYEIGWKSTLLDGRLRLNGAAYFMEWDDMQFSRFDGSVSPLTLTDNIGKAESKGVEADVAWLVADNWTVSGAISINRAELTTDYFRSPADLAAGIPNAPKGSVLPRVPELKWNVATRYNGELMGRPTYIQASYVYTGESWNALFGESTATRGRQLQKSYQIVNLAYGIEQDSWSAELYLRNAFDERGEVFRNAATWDSRITINRPRTFGIRFRQRFE